MSHSIVEHLDTSGCSKKLVLEVPRQDLEAEIAKGFEEVRKNVTLHGFRKGRAPLALLKKMFGKAVEKDAVQKVMEETGRAVFAELELRVVGEPTFSDPSHEGEDPLRFTLELEHVPRFELGDYQAHDIGIEPREVGEAEVGRVLERLRESAATLAALPERPAQKGDVAILNVKAECEGVQVADASHERYQLELGAGRHIPGFEEAVLGMNPGETRTVELDFPPDYVEAELQGKPGRFTIELLELKEKILPTLDDEFAKDFGAYESLSELKDRLRRDLEAEAKAGAFAEARRKLSQRLVESIVFPVPPSLIEGQAAYLGAMQNMELSRLGTSLDQLGQDPEKVREDNLAEGERQARLSLILTQIAEKEGIQLTSDEYLQYLIQLARERGQHPEWFVQNVESNQLHPYYQRRALENKVYNVLLGIVPREPEGEGHVHGPECEHGHAEAGEASAPAEPAEAQTEPENSGGQAAKE